MNSFNIFVFGMAIFLLYAGIKNLLSIKKPQSKYGADTSTSGYTGEKIFGKRYAPVSHLVYGIIELIGSIILFSYLIK